MSLTVGIIIGAMFPLNFMYGYFVFIKFRKQNRAVLVFHKLNIFCS